ncbi:hypothetical protein QFZ63_003725 [Streptomyces sp. B3I7]|nr:hypothetical protein [Streptomyces sp. B3I7]
MALPAGAFDLVSVHHFPLRRQAGRIDEARPRIAPARGGMPVAAGQPRVRAEGRASPHLSAHRVPAPDAFARASGLPPLS